MSDKFKAIISVGGRFHAFNLAQQLEKRRALKKLITSYPKFEVKKYGIPPEKIGSVLIKEILERGWRQLPAFLHNIYNPQYLIHEIFDKSVSYCLESADLFVGWSSFSLHSLRKAKKMGMTTVIDRGSSHILYQQKILKEEYDNFGVKIQLAHPKIIEKELKEYEEADYVTIPSLFVKRTFLDQGFPENKLIHVPYGVDLSQFRQIPKEDNVFRVIFVGGMTLQKGVHYLLRAFSELNLPNSELMLIGAISNEIKPFFKKYKVSMFGRPTSSGRRTSPILFIGHVPQRELYKYYSQSSVFVLNSIQDGFGMVIIQAMACSLPVITTENTGGPDIVRDRKDGFIIPIRDAEKLKEKLIYLYENPEIRLKMGQSAKERVASGFTWDDYGDKTVEAYKKILKIYHYEKNLAKN
jgi:glycosyltransferase involved in cell wall biosynthesis